MTALPPAPDAGRASSLHAEPTLLQVLSAVRCVVWHVAVPSMVSLYISENAEDVLGYPVAAWREPGHWWSVVHPDDRAEVEAVSDAARERGEAFEREYRIIRPDGTACWLHDTVAFVRDACGTIVEMRGVALDVTARRTCGDELRYDRTRRQIAMGLAGVAGWEWHLLDSLGEAVSVTRREGTLLYVNAALERMFGYAPGELDGVSIRVLSARAPAEYDRRTDEMVAAVLSKGSWTGPMTSRRKDGSQLQTHGTITRVVVDGEPLWITIRQDMTERHRLQREVLEASQREKEELALQLHEGLGQQLTGTALLASSLRDAAAREQSPLAANVRRLAELLLEAVGTCRRLAQGVSGIAVRQGGLEVGLRALALAYERRYGGQCEVAADHKVAASVDPETARHLYWIVEDALAIAGRHASLMDVRVQLDRDAGRVRLRVHLPRITPAQLVEIGGAALRIMGYRAALLGAGLETSQSDASEVVIDCICPMDRKAE
jgi:PAS domain S-box-containing protein